MRRVLIPIAIAATALLLAACGTEDVSVTSAEQEEGAQLFADHCAGCHTLAAAGTQGSGNRSLRVQGPNLDQRAVSYEDALFAIHNGGASGAVMPQNIVAGEDAEQVARFIEEYSGSEVEDAGTGDPSADAGS
ncbi:MAG TPA: c-type cytochrome [Solirubrobacterales bacterium]|nr:c-type cytochrome [Solirubrobacterales bacterium]